MGAVLIWKGTDAQLLCSGTILKKDGTPLLGSGFFSTFQTPSGTSPVSDSTSDTLTFTSSDSSVGITGNATTDTIDFRVTPAGSSGEVQYNAAGSLGADSNFKWDNTNKRVGIQASTPQAPFHAASSVGSTIANVTSGSVSTSTASSLSAPSGSATATRMFDAPTTPAAVETTGTGFVASGQGLDYYIYALKLSNGAYYQSQNAAYANYTDTSNDSHDFAVSVSWDAVSGADAYLVSAPSGTYIVTSTSWVDYNTGGSDSTQGWPTYYTSNEGNSVAPTYLSASQNYGYTGLTSDGTTYKVEIDSYVTIGGVNYSSGTPYALSPDYYDGNSSSQYGLQLDNSGGSGNGYIIRISTNGGSSWRYIDIGSAGSYIYEGQPNETAAETAWNNPFSGFTGRTHYFRIYERGTTPIGNSYYSASFGSWSVVIPNDGAYYLVEHTLSGIVSQAKVTASDDGISYGYGRIVSDSFVDPGYVYWSDGVVVTPTTYGYSGTSQVNSYRIYSYDGSIYSQTPLTLTTSSTGGEKYYTLSWSLPSGITQVKITKSVNGGAYSQAKSVVGTTLTDTYDQTWPASTTVTPNTAVTLTGRVDSNQSAVTEPPALAIVNTYSSGNRTSMIAFGVAASSASAATFQSYIFGSSSNGNVNIVGGDLRYAANLSTWAAGTQQTFFRGYVGTGSLNFGTVSAHSYVDRTVSVVGAATGDIAMASPYSTPGAGFVWCAWVSGTNTITVRLSNITGSSVAANTVTWKVAAVKNT